jgi:predicted nucleic acid-binding protein
MRASSVAATIDNIPAGTAVFLDANILVYAFENDPRFGAACQGLLQRIENADLTGFTSSSVAAEMAHRLMTLEAAAVLGRSLTGMASWLRRHPAEVQRLSRHRQAIDELGLVRVTILPVTGPQVSHAVDLSLLHGFLTNDALIVIVMQHNGLSALASNDADFDRVPGLTRYAPA